MKVRDLMTSDPFAVLASDTVQRAAELMRTINVGALPVVRRHDDRRLVGMITDRDIATRCVAAGHVSHCTVKTHMTVAPLHTVQPDDDADLVVERMERGQVRRLPVVSGDDLLVGIVAQADLARKLGPESPKTMEEVIEAISSPTVPA